MKTIIYHYKRVCTSVMKFNLYLVFIELLLLLQMSLQALCCGLGLSQILLQPLHKKIQLCYAPRGKTSETTLTKAKIRQKCLYGTTAMQEKKNSTNICSFGSCWKCFHQEMKWIQ